MIAVNYSWLIFFSLFAFVCSLSWDEGGSCWTHSSSSSSRLSISISHVQACINFDIYRFLLTLVVWKIANVWKLSHGDSAVCARVKQKKSWLASYDFVFWFIWSSSRARESPTIWWQQECVFMNYSRQLQTAAAAGYNVWYLSERVLIYDSIVHQLRVCTFIILSSFIKIDFLFHLFFSFFDLFLRALLSAKWKKKHFSSPMEKLHSFQTEFE